MPARAGIFYLTRFFDFLYEIIKKEVCVVGTTAGFRVELYAERRDVCVRDSFAGVVVYVYKAELGEGWQCITFYSVAMILTGDVDTAGL